MQRLAAPGFIDVIVTRHPAALRWLASHPALHDPFQISHLDEAQLQTLVTQARASHAEGLRFFGVFPLQLAARLCGLGAECWALDVNMPTHWRGRELNFKSLASLQPMLVRYHVYQLSTRLSVAGNPCNDKFKTSCHTRYHDEHS